MVFSSIIFLFGFLPAFLILYFCVPARFKNYVALFGSCFFYAWGAPRFIFVLLGSTLLDYFLGWQIYKCTEQPRKKKALLILSLCMNLGLLAFFKYFNFFVSQVNALLHALSLSHLNAPTILLPLGISFFTFHKITYMVDIYRGTVPPANSYFDFFLYILLFPQLIAGPIVRYHELDSQIRERNHTIEKIFDGIYRFCLGLAKKVLIANQLGSAVDIIFSMQPARLTTLYAWGGILCYAFQIYFDFSGYSDMAIGLGKLMGFDFPENFNLPYISKNITEFWRRWHISLSNFMREYVFMPFGGSRGSKARTYLNLWLVFVLAGFWHGAAWTFVFWGAYHGLLLTLDRMFWLKVQTRIPAIFNAAITFFLLLIGWVFFRAENISRGFHYLGRMFDLAGQHAARNPLPWGNIFTVRCLFVLIVAAIISFLPLITTFQRVVGFLTPKFQRPGYLRFQFASSLLLFFLSVLALANSRFNPFIYFRF
ncbi:MAG: MBOAT family protein [Acidobacteria bacterium]|nr:MAG: MBOAT family protein [Acidobacteriota bacterium]